MVSENQLMFEKKAIVAVDIGGTNTEIGLFENGDLIATQTVPTIRSTSGEITDNPKEYLDVLADRIKELVNSQGFTGIRAVGMGVPGRVDSDNGMALSAANLFWKNVPIAKEMSKRLDANVWIDNDVRIYALGEATAGAGIGYQNMICITLGTGLAAGVILNGSLLRGSHLLAGEIGHDKVENNTIKCNCGEIGCLETIASASGIAKLAKQAVNNNEKTSLATLQSEIQAADVYQAAVNGDKVANNIFDYVGSELGKKLAAFISLVDPDAIIVGGGVAKAGDMILNPIRKQVANNFTLSGNSTEIVQGKLGNKAGLIGAAHFALSGGVVDGE